MANIQFNTKSGKSFREIMAKYNDAQHGLNDYICSKSDRVNSLKMLIASNEEELSKIDNGVNTVIRDRKTIEDETKSFYEKLEEESVNLANAREEAQKRLEDAEKLVTKTLYEYALTDDFNTHFAKFFVDNGFSDATSENVPTLHFGTKKNSAKTSFNSGNLVGKMAFRQWRTLFLCTLCDTLVEQNVISAYKYNYVKPSKNNK